MGSWCVVHQYGGLGVSLRSAPASRGYYGAPFFTDEFPHLLAAADLVICRAGANNVWELAALGKPSVLVPLPLSASRGDQLANARVFAGKGAAVRLEQETLTPDSLYRTVAALMNDPQRLKTMGRLAAELARPDAARRIAELLAVHLGWRLVSRGAGATGERHLWRA